MLRRCINLRKKTAWMLILAFAMILYIAFLAWLIISYYKDNLDLGVTALSVLTSCLALPLTIYSTFVLFNDIRNGCICTNGMAKAGEKVLSEKINSFQPTVIIYVAGCSNKFFEAYLAKHINLNCRHLVLSATERRYICPYNPKNVLLTNKFFIDTTPLKTINSNERVIILDDVTKTGDTIKRNKSYILISRHLSKLNILTCSFIVDKFGYANCAEPAVYFKKTEVRDDYNFPWR